LKACVKVPRKAQGQITERFGAVAAAVDRMERTSLDRLQQLDFVTEAS
jgi:hypothetical protein